VFSILAKYTNKIQVKSCDEALLDLSEQVTSLEEAAKKIQELRDEVLQSTRIISFRGY